MKLPQFSLRDVFWLFLVVGFACAWWFQEGRIAEVRRKLVETEQRLKNEERIAAGLQAIINAYRSDGRLSDVRRADGSVYITDKKVFGGFSD
jgi:hypothetical protein